MADLAFLRAVDNTASWTPQAPRRNDSAKAGRASGWPASGWPGGTIRRSRAQSASAPIGSASTAGGSVPVMAFRSRCRRTRAAVLRRRSASVYTVTPPVTPDPRPTDGRMSAPSPPRYDMGPHGNALW